jgi:hypothetical protein
MTVEELGDMVREDLPNALDLLDQCETVLRQVLASWEHNAHDPGLADTARALLAKLEAGDK